MFHVEFLGGPFDGHREPFARDEPLPEHLTWLVSQNIFRHLEGEPEIPVAPITSVAVYQRGREGDKWCYRFARAISPHELQNRWSAGGDWLKRLVSSLFGR
jgi:hypothetical protein